MIEKIHIEGATITVDTDFLGGVVYLRTDGNFADVSDAGIRRLSRTTASLVAKFDQQSSLIDCRHLVAPKASMASWRITAEENAKRLGFNHKVGWLSQGEFLEDFRLASLAMNDTGILKAGGFSRWEEICAYLKVPGLVDPTLLSQRLGAEIRSSSLSRGSQTSLETLTTPFRPQV